MNQLQIETALGPATLSPELPPAKVLKPIFQSGPPKPPVAMQRDPGIGKAIAAFRDLKRA
jgi:hypothetical protein